MHIAAIAGKTALPYADSVKQLLADNAAHMISCGDYALSLASLSSTDLPRQLTSELALAAVRDKAKHKKLGKILTGFRSETLKRGFDAVLTYEVQGTQLRLYGISGADDVKVVVSSLPLSDASDQKKFNIAACKALASLPVLAAP
ncbi:hypothetical protein PO883_18110 [Massilia sp. DJPM01]|uniref:hypothetical protein n=1 Tax=Massilia sp. DJPM01 TaxID=3024404 RepID=UPI00259EF843|nr:hypothetical protein [Massilia sp. DJPM01]MDM5179114.1 hypothetical protein [Massilia sp. DJPM01]